MGVNIGCLNGGGGMLGAPFCCHGYVLLRCVGNVILRMKHNNY